MEIYNNIVCITPPELTAGVPKSKKIQDRQIMSLPAYKSYVSRNPEVKVRRACKNNPALLAVDSLRSDLKALVFAKYGEPEKVAKRGGLIGLYTEDVKAAEYYARYILPDGTVLKSQYVTEYTANASMLNTIIKLISSRTLLRRAMGNSVRGMWLQIAEEVAELKTRYKHTLPENSRRLKAKTEEYKNGGYDVLVSKNFCNKNRMKVNEELEHLLLSLYCLPEKPYVSTVLDLYLQFLAGANNVVSLETGELFDRNDFFDKDGMPLVISDKTVWNYINNPKNRVIVDKHRNDQDYFTHLVRPHHHRKPPVYSFSKISMDDRDLPRKMKNGSRVKAYYTYDVCSGAIIGKAYAYSKNKDLFIDCVRDMFRFLDLSGFGIPVEVEVEHHLVNNFKNDLMKAGTVFPMVRWCNAGNSQEKYAEPMNRVKKYGYEKRYQQGIGRFYSRLEANRPKQEKIFDEENNNYKERTYTFEELVADDLNMVEKYNNAPHPDKKKYPDMSRLDVLRANPNPAMAKFEKSYIAQFIGEKVKTSVKRNSTATVQYNEYQLPTPELLERFASNKYEVDAYYLPTEAGTIDEVYFYQKGQYICTCQRLDGYNRARCEWTEQDEQSYTEQAAYVKQFDDMSKQKKTQRVKIIDAEMTAAIKEAVNKVNDPPPLPPISANDWNNDFSEYSPEVIRKLALKNL